MSKAKNISDKLSRFHDRLIQKGVGYLGNNIAGSSPTTQVASGNDYVGVIGDQVAFEEFGAGVFYNGQEPYPVPRPTNVLPIGEYGHKQGRKDGWLKPDGTYTHGTKAMMYVHRTATQLREDVRKHGISL